MDQQTQIIVGVAVFSLIAFAIWTFRDVGNRRYRPRENSNRDQPSTTGSGCNCQRPPQDGCIAAVDCVHPMAPPIAIRGLSCNPNDPQFVHASDIQMFVDAMNQQREQDRVADSITRFRSAFDRMDSESASTKKK